MFLTKIKSRKSGIILYGITPPKSQTEPDKVQEIAKRTLSRLIGLDIDALIVYDVQDESARTSDERPFPFIRALDPLEYTIAHLHELNKPKIIYRPAGKYTSQELSTWLNTLHINGLYPVFVGVPIPGFQVKTSLQEAYAIWSKNADTSVIGAITIPERHATLHDEPERMMDKMKSGVSFFVSQCVFNIEYAKNMLTDLATYCKNNNASMPTVIFTLTACGSTKTLQFMEWLGIHIPDTIKNELINGENILSTSIEICKQVATTLTEHCLLHNIPFGFNIESVAIRKEEIEASIELVNWTIQLFKKNGIRQ
ncbi:MAG: hypothetical protein NW207_12875 [Cytophagales bacterium]|nr:hypothetical protein [Cytophagales bacterium]